MMRKRERERDRIRQGVEETEFKVVDIIKVVDSMAPTFCTKETLIFIHSVMVTFDIKYIYMIVQINNNWCNKHNK